MPVCMDDIRHLYIVQMLQYTCFRIEVVVGLAIACEHEVRLAVVVDQLRMLSRG